MFEWALLLPMAMPAYVLAYTYTDFLQFVGPVQTGLRESFGWRRSDYWFPEVRSLGGAIAMFGFVLYPYVYLIVRTAFLERARGHARRRARARPRRRWRAFLRVSLPLARPAIAAGVALALMETLADYGTVAYFAVPTFTTGIYRAWFSLGDRAAAAQLAAGLLAFVLLLLALERASRGRARYHDTSLRRAGARHRLTGLRRGAGGVRLPDADPARLRCCRPRCCSGWRSARARRNSAARFVRLAAQQLHGGRAGRAAGRAAGGADWPTVRDWRAYARAAAWSRAWPIASSASATPCRARSSPSAC